MQPGSEVDMFPILSGLIAGIVASVGMWKVFSKAGKPGWAAIIPFYNTFTWVKVAGKPGWWFFLFLVPLVNIVIYFIVSIEVAKRFGKGTMFGIFLLGIFGTIGYLILGFGKSTYTSAPSAPATPPAAAAPPPTPPAQT